MSKTKKLLAKLLNEHMAFTWPARLCKRFCNTTVQILPRRSADYPNRRYPNTADPSTTAPATNATQNPLVAPKWSIIQPELAAPMATPMLRPVISQVMPSVRRLAGTICSTRAMATIRVGAKNSPEIKIATASPGMLVTSSNGKVVNAVATPQNRNCRGNGALSFRVPNANPARHEPMAYTDSTILGESDADHVHHADDHPHGQQQDHQDQHRR